jgi:hypothetical protein
VCHRRYVQSRYCGALNHKSHYGIRGLLMTLGDGSDLRSNARIAGLDIIVGGLTLEALLERAGGDGQGGD